ncbi:RNA polymerase sigma factor [Parapedobacter pyrenivorans]|uniref:RNA polymerase sigma factor n=1 Tax=Parapedobacter pyrenivorans TaxID=1305674 RepID=UPI00333EFC19
MINHNPPNAPGTTSGSLLFRLKTPDEAAWERFVDVYGPLVMHWIRRRCEACGLPTDRRDDVVQDVFLSVRQYIGNFERQRTGSFRKWLRKIVNSRVIDVSRNSKQKERTFSETELDVLHKIPDPSIDETERSREREILFQSIIAVVAKDFGPATRKIMEETMIGDRPDSEIAAALGMTENAVRQTRQRIKKRIRDEFGDMMDEEPSR